jgi:FixJ family two-component response regulator
MPVILITGWGDVVEPPAGTVVDGIITKPFDVSRLTSVVEQALRERRAPRAS